jgi:aspartyl-tRNA(Asn)/glutamyl-tRNA(Gln) amidotransferase subunit A
MHGYRTASRRDRDGGARVTNLAYLSATEALARFRSRDLSPVELMEAVIERAEAVEPAIGALADTYFDEAIEAAKVAEARYAGKSGEPGALEGLPVAIKDEVAVEGRRNTSGSLIFAEGVADHTAPTAERILAAGAIVHARTRTPEFSCQPFTHSRLWGITRNPWNQAFDVGGSSGGSAAALASGTATLAGGSDIGGSIRIPASCCGVVGFKPPYGRVPQEPPFNLDHYCHEGPLARTVADCALFENVLAGPHTADITSIKPKVTIPAELDSIEGWRIAYSPNLGNYNVDPEVEANARAAAEAFREAGATVEEIALSWEIDKIREAARAHFGTIFGPLVAYFVAEQGDLMTDYAIEFAAWSANIPPGGYYQGLEYEGAMYAEFGALMEHYDLLVSPTLGLAALEAGKSYVGDGPVVNGRQQHIIDHLMTIPFNILSRCPVMSVPSGFTKDGVPTGIQIVGRTYDDIAVFRAAATFERLRPWLDIPSRRPAL